MGRTGHLPRFRALESFWELGCQDPVLNSHALSSALPLSNKPSPNQINVNNVKAGVVNGTGAPGQSPGAGRACESCYSKCPWALGLGAARCWLGIVVPGLVLRLLCPCLGGP